MTRFFPNVRQLFVLAALTPLASAQLGNPAELLSKTAPSTQFTATDDVDGDGQLDLIYTNRGAGTLEWVSVVGTGRYVQPTRLVELPFVGESLSQGDLDGDGDEDLVFVGGQASSPPELLLLRRGPGGFDSPPEFLAPMLAGGQGQIVADVDGDGDLDVVRGEVGTSIFLIQDVVLYENLGAAGFAAGRPIFTLASGSILKIAANDLNGDGETDLLVGSNQALTVLFGTGGGSFAPPVFLPTSASSVRSLLTEDLDGDGDIDVLVGESAVDGVSILENLGGGAFAAAAPLGGMPDAAYGLALLDLDLDGRRDLVATSDSGTFYYAGDGLGGFAAAVNATGSNAPGPRQIIASDFTFDGVADLAGPVAVNSVGSMGFLEHRGAGQTPLLEDPLAIELRADEEVRGIFANLSGDDVLEVVVTGGSSVSQVSVLTQVGPGTPNILIPQPAVGTLGVAHVAAADLTGNGLDDLMVRTTANELYVVPCVAPLQLGAPVFVRAVSPGAALLAEDFDFDGDLDIVTTLTSGLTLAGLPNLGSLSFGSPSAFYGLAVPSREVLFADLDGDGDRDFAVLELLGAAISRRVLWFERVGTTFAAPAVLANVLSPPNSFVAFDVDGDDRQDLFWTTVSTGGVWVQSLSGGSFAPATSVPGLLSNAGDHYALDEDLDGDQDLVELQLFGQIGLATNDGSGSYNGRLLSSAGASQVRVADRDGDGDMDLLVSGYLDSSLLYFENEASGSIGTNYCGPAVANSTGESAGIEAAGSSFAGANVASLRATGMPTNAFGFFLASQQTGSVLPVPGSSGRLCLGGSIGRYVGPGQIQQSAQDGTFGLQLDLGMIPQPNGFVAGAPGDTWNFQAWFRDVDPAGSATSNFTDGVAVTLQ